MKKIPSFSILIFFFTLSLIGWALLSSLPLQLNPSDNSRFLQISYNWPDASPKAIENLVTAPLEAVLSQIDKIDNIHSVSQNGKGFIEIEVSKFVDISYMRFEIAAAIRRIFRKLPLGVSYPRVIISGSSDVFSDTPILSYAFIGNEKPNELYKFLKEEIAPSISTVKGIRDIQIYGNQSVEWLIKYDWETMNRIGVTVDDIKKSIKHVYDNSSLGTYQDSIYNWYVSIENENILPLQWEEIPIKRIKNRQVYLKDIAKIVQAYQKTKQYYRVNGQNSLRLVIYPRKEFNVLTLAKNIQSYISKIKKELPNKFHLQLEEDNTSHISLELSKITFRSLLSLFILIIFSLIIYKNLQQLFIIIFSLIVNLGISVFIFYIFKIELHIYALAGITVSFGLLLDNILITIDHINKQKKNRIFSALIAVTLTSTSALVIIFFLPDFWKSLLTNLGVVIIVNLERV